MTTVQWRDPALEPRTLEQLMPSLATKPYRLYEVFLFAVLLCFAASSQAQDQVVVAVVLDGPSARLASQQKLYVDELLVLTENEFDVEIRNFVGEWTKDSTLSTIDAAYADADVDLVLIVGFVANQLAATRSEFPKPTFLPVILDTGLLKSGAKDGTSGVRNLNYLNAYANFSDDLDTLSRFTPYRKLVLFVDENLSYAIPQLRDAALEVSTARGIELIEVTHDGADHRLMNRVPVGTEAIFIAALPRMPDADFAELVTAINAAGLPSFSFVGVTDVERGLLATDREPKDVDRQARLNALNMQAVMLGERTQDQPIASAKKEQLTINMATARQIGLSPSFDLLNDAVLLNRVAKVTGEEYGLVEIVRMAIEQNQDLQAETYGVQAGLEEIARARANLLPQIGASANHIVRNDSPLVSAGLFAERSSDAAFSVDQLLYSDAASANLKIQKELQNSRLASLDEFKLDVVLAASTSYYAVLNARSQLAVQENNLRISKANLELAKTRVRLGSSTAADVYRWQAEVARAQILVLNVRAAENQAHDTLNRILHKPQGVRLALREATFNEPFVMTRKDFDQLIASPADYAIFSRFYIDRALRQAPELEQLDAQILAKQRDLTSQRRSYWLPDFSIGGSFTSNLGQSGLGAGPSAGEDLNDWSVGLQATLPIFSGGLKKANVSRASFELRQLESLRYSTEERVEESIRRQLHSAQAAYAQIDLTATAAEASLKNYNLVSDAYARGAVTVIELLDAQETSLRASAASAESLYNFLTVIMAMQRAVGGFDYLLPPDERNALADEFRRTLTGTR
jgi:outer membrane protein TolC